MSDWGAFGEALAGAGQDFMSFYLPYMMQQEAEQKQKDEESAMWNAIVGLLGAGGATGAGKMHRSGMDELDPGIALQLMPLMESEGLGPFAQPKPEEPEMRPAAMMALMDAFGNMDLPAGIAQKDPEDILQYLEVMQGMGQPVGATQEEPGRDFITEMVMQEMLGGMEMPPELAEKDIEDQYRYAMMMQELQPEPEQPGQTYQFGAGGGTLVGPGGIQTIPPIEQPPSAPSYTDIQRSNAMRTDRHNNPTAMIEDFVAMLGGVEGVDYVRGDPFAGGDGNTYYTARILGDGMTKTIELFDRGAQSGSIPGGVFSWWNGISDEQWLSKTPEEKEAYINSIYQMEGGTNTSTGWRGITTDEPSEIRGVYDVSAAELEDNYLNATEAERQRAIEAVGGRVRRNQSNEITSMEPPDAGWDAVYRELWNQQNASIDTSNRPELSETANALLEGIFAMYGQGRTMEDIIAHVDYLIKNETITPEEGDAILEQLASAVGV